MDDLDTFGELAGRLGFQLHRVDVRAMADLSAHLAKYGITPARATATVFIALHEGCDQMALGRALAINRASTMKVVNELVALGIVERRSGRDQRSNALYLTPAGHALRHDIERVTKQHDRRIFGVLSEAERADLRSILAKLSREKVVVTPRAKRPRASRLRSVN